MAYKYCINKFIKNTNLWHGRRAGQLVKYKANKYFQNPGFLVILKEYLVAKQNSVFK